jgi:hypothetical protein
VVQNYPIKIKNPTITEFINALTPVLTEFLQKCRNRYIAFDNTLKGSEAEILVKQLLEIIEKMVSANTPGVSTKLICKPNLCASRS